MVKAPDPLGGPHNPRETRRLPVPTDDSEWLPREQRNARRRALIALLFAVALGVVAWAGPGIDYFYWTPLIFALASIVSAGFALAAAGESENARWLVVLSVALLILTVLSALLVWLTLLFFHRFSF